MAVKIHSCATLRKRGLSEFSFTIHWPLQLQLGYVLDYGFLRFRLQLNVTILQLDIFVYNCMWQHYSGTMFWTTASCFSVYNCMWPRGSPQWSVQVFEETFQRVALENRLRGPLMDLENHLMKSTTVSTNRGLNETLIILTTGLSNRRTLNLQASAAFCWTHLAKWFVFRSLHFLQILAFWHWLWWLRMSLQPYTTLQIFPVLFRAYHTDCLILDTLSGIYGGICWMHLCPVGQI